MATKDLITKVWIEEGCIVCDACETAAPDVFEVQDETCVIRPAALDASFTKPLSSDIEDAAEECPVDVIKFDTITEEVPDGEAEPAKPSEPAEEKPTAAEKAPPTPSTTASEKPAEKKKAKPEVATVTASMAGQPDPAIAGLLRAATARGGNAGILKKEESMPGGAEAWQKKDPNELPPDARQTKVLEAAKKAKQDPDSSRRALVSSAALAVGWGAFGLGAGVAGGPAFARFMMPNVLEEPDPRVRVGKLAQYIEMEPGAVNEAYKPQGIWMIREEGRVVALNIICTHLGCIPNWLPNDRKFKCPCHGSGYKPDGINFEGPTPRPLERFRLYMSDGIVVVDKSKKYQYELGQWDMLGSFLEV